MSPLFELVVFMKLVGICLSPPRRIIAAYLWDMTDQQINIKLTIAENAQSAGTKNNSRSFFIIATDGLKGTDRQTVGKKLIIHHLTEFTVLPRKVMLSLNVAILLWLFAYVNAFRTALQQSKIARTFTLASTLKISEFTSLAIGIGLSLSVGNVKLAVEAIRSNPEALTCTIDTQNVKENQSSCQQMDQIVRFRSGRLLTIKQDWGGSVSTGASVWNGENVAVKYLEETLGPKLKGKSVIELGAGVGYSSLIANILGASEVVITDGNEDVLKLADENVKNNLDVKPPTIVRTARLRWNTEDELNFKDRSWDYVLASDVTYKKSAWKDLLHTIAELSTENTKTILSMEPRNVGEVEGVLREAANFGLDSIEEPLSRRGSVCNLLCPRLFILSKHNS